MRIIHIVDRFDKINFGIWNAAIFGSEYLLAKHQITSVLWHPSTSFTFPVSVQTYSTNFASISVDQLIQEQGLQADVDIIVTHGCWQFPTRLGFALQKKGFVWVYVPHGMLEPWSMQQKKWKKLLYFHFVEKRLSKNATAIRAVGSIEHKNLCKTYTNKAVALVENGVKIPILTHEKPKGITRYLFMARLHFKKGILPLVEAWTNIMGKNVHAELIIAGPDEGELAAISALLTENIRYVGAVYGEEKIQLLSNAHYYILPSFSEGFPVSVLEAMSYGCIPIITDGCNFPSVFENKLGYKITPEVEDISNVLQQLNGIDFNISLSQKNKDFIAAAYSEAKIGEALLQLYRKTFQRL